MADWIVSTGRKDLTEVQIWTKDDSQFEYSTVWRGGTWIVTTSDDNPPQIEGADENGIVDMGWLEGPNIVSCEFESTHDGCYDEWKFSDDIDEAEQERIIEGWEEDAYSFLEEDGWLDDDTYFYATLDNLTIEKADEL
jgi:hypothetical protein